MTPFAEARLVEIVDSAPDRLAEFCAQRAVSAVRVVCDRNTRSALGDAVERRLRAATIGVESTLFEGDVEADVTALGQLLVDEGDPGTLLVAVGSGTVTDIVRYVASRIGAQFVSLPTAASVDAYTSACSPLVVRGAKRTLQATPPLAVFVQMDVLRAAPKAMTAAGFGDLICKFSALADWRLGALVWGEPWDADTASRMREAVSSCARAADSIGEADVAGLRILISGLLESGSAMARCGHSRPASGAEHHFSHFWEMRLLQEGRAPILHGLKVGAATAITSALWERIAALGPKEFSARLDAATLPAPEAEIEQIRKDYGPAAEEIIELQRRFLSLDREGFDALKATIHRHRSEISDIAKAVPGWQETSRLLVASGCPVDPRDLGLGEAEIAAAARSAHFLRDRFTVLKLARLLGIAPSVDPR